MIPEDDIDTDEDGESYEPEAISLADGEAILFDPAEFEEAFNAFGAMFSNGCLFYLDKDSRRWVNVEDHGKPRPTSVRKMQ